MSKSIEILESLEVTSSSNAKLKILADNLGDAVFAEIVDAVYNYRHKYWLDDLSFIKDVYNPGVKADTELTWKVFKSVLDKLRTREVTGDAAKTLVYNYFLNYADEIHAKWMQRILKKDLRIGVGISSVVKAGYNVPDFDVMLAKDARKCKKLAQLVKAGVWTSRKYDGYRCLAVVEDYDVTLFTRSGTVYDNFPTIKSAIADFCRDLSLPDVVFDGEIMSDSFQAMQRSAFASKRGTTVGDMKYHIFDTVPLYEWKSQDFRVLAGNRFLTLSGYFNACSIKDLPLVEVKHNWMTDLTAIESTEKLYIEAGYEGLMALPQLPYYIGKKSNKMLKFKQFETMEATIVGLYEGEGKYEGTLGGMHLIQENGEKVNCAWRGDAERDEIWQNPESIVGRTIELKYQELSDDNVARFPVFVRFRDDKQK